MTSRRSPSRGFAAVWTTLAIATVSLAGCTAANPPKPPPPPIQDTSRAPAAGPTAAAPAAVAPPVAAPPAAPPTMPAVLAQAISAAPAPANVDEGSLPTAKDLAAGMVAALSKARTARLTAHLPNGHSTDLVYVAPDRASLVEYDENGQEYAQYVIVGDSGYTYQSSSGAGWRKVQNEGFRKQTQVFRPMQVAVATGKPRTLDSGGDVEVVDVGDKRGLHAVFEYTSSAELEELGLMRSGANILDVVVDPTTWLPIATREETQGAVTQVQFVSFDEPASVEAPPA
jgi:hypothetical protein